MKNVLLTAFEPYDEWTSNASWLALVELTKESAPDVEVTTRLYPVDFDGFQSAMATDLERDFDVALHLGQAPGSGGIDLESVGINMGGNRLQIPEEYQPLVEDGPVAYRSTLPLAAWARTLRASGIPARLSFHAGTFLCNATLYFSHYLAEKMGLKTQSAFLHIPLDPSQVVDHRQNLASQPAPITAAAVRILLDEVARM